MAIMSPADPWLYPVGLCVIAFLFGLTVWVRRSNRRSAQGVAAWNARAERAARAARPEAVTYRVELQTIHTVPGRVSGRILALSPTAPADPVPGDWSICTVFTLDSLLDAVRHSLLFVEAEHAQAWETSSPAPTCRVEWVLDGGPVREVPPTTLTARKAVTTPEVAGIVGVAR